MRMAAPETRGVPAATQAAFTSKRVSKLSLASTTASAFSTSRTSSGPSIAQGIASTRTSGFMAATADRAASTLSLPRSEAR